MNKLEDRKNSPRRFYRVISRRQNPESSSLPLAAALYGDRALDDATLAAVVAARARADPHAEGEDAQKENGKQR